MALAWFMLIYFLLSTSSPSASDEANEFVGNQSNIKLNIYHVQAPGSDLIPTESWSLSDILLHDEEHVKTLGKRVGKKGAGKNVSDDTPPQKYSMSSGHILKSNSAGSLPVNPGFSIGSGNYYVKLGIGSPPKYYAMILDTGSSLSWLQCQPCTIYCHNQVDPLFDPAMSRTYRSLSCSTPACSLLKDATLNDPFCESKSNKCIYTATYGDASYSIGYLSQDLLTLAPSQALSNFVFGCGVDNQGLFGRGAGTIGLSRDKLSMLNQLSTKYGYAFSYCLPTSSSSGGGFLSIGKISGSAYKFTPMIKGPTNSNLYFLRLIAITVAGRPLQGVAAAQYYKIPTIIDSGTVITRLPMPVYAALQQAFVRMMSGKYERAPAFSILDTCFRGRLQSMYGVPGIQMIFQGGAGLALTPSNFLIETDNGVTCLAFAATSGSNQIAIIGNHQQQTFSVAYDVSTSRIGFAPRGCH